MGNSCYISPEARDKLKERFIYHTYISWAVMSLREVFVPLMLPLLVCFGGSRFSSVARDAEVCSTLRLPLQACVVGVCMYVLLHTCGIPSGLTGETTDI